MAKKKPTTPAKPRSTGRSSSKNVDTALERVVETEVAALETSDVTVATSEPRAVGAISDVEIGHVAGDVWGTLSRTGPLTLAAIKKEVNAPGDLVTAAIGWLAREDKLDFSNSGRTVKIGLRG